jgi:hypothetical protein
MRVGVGGAAFAADASRVGAAICQVDATVFPIAHVGLVVGARRIVIPNYRNGRLSLLPWTVGVSVR